MPITFLKLAAFIVLMTVVFFYLIGAAVCWVECRKAKMGIRNKRQDKDILIVTGPTGSGKTTLINELMSQNIGFKRIVPCTTREKRPGEEDGLDYYFLSQDQYDELDRGWYFDTDTRYKIETPEGPQIIYYGYYFPKPMDDIVYIISLGPDEISQFFATKENLRDRAIVLEVQADEETLLQRCEERGDYIPEVKRRIEKDRLKFQILNEKGLIDRTVYSDASIPYWEAYTAICMFENNLCCG